MILGVVVDPPADFRGPQLDAIVLEQRRHRRVLGAVEGPLVFPDHDRVPPAVRISQRSDQGRSPRAARPGQRPAVAGVEELGHDAPVPGHQRGSLVPLPRPRRHRVLPVLGRDPPVKREAQRAVTMAGGPTVPGALGPCRKRIPVLAARRLPSEMTASRKFTNHRCRLPQQVPGAQSPMSLPARQRTQPPPGQPVGHQPCRPARQSRTRMIQHSTRQPRTDSARLRPC